MPEQETTFELLAGSDCQGGRHGFTCNASKRWRDLLLLVAIKFLKKIESHGGSDAGQRRLARSSRRASSLARHSSGGRFESRLTTRSASDFTSGAVERSNSTRSDAAGTRGTGSYPCSGESRPKNACSAL